MTEHASETVRIADTYPVMEGNAFRDGDNLLHLVDAAAITMTSLDGTQRTIALRRGTNGEWRAPAEFD